MTLQSTIQTLGMIKEILKMNEIPRDIPDNPSRVDPPEYVEDEDEPETCPSCGEFEEDCRCDEEEEEEDEDD
jgi:hypothetical protein